METRISECPLGPDLQHYWDRLSARETHMKMDRQGLYSLTIQEVAIRVADLIPGERVIDPFCGVGGDAIAFARSGKSVIAIEQDPARLEMAKQNAELFGVADKIQFIEGDATKLLHNHKADAVYLDMPWGGPDYYRRDSFGLNDFSPSGLDMLKAAFEVSDRVIMKLPKNFDSNELKALGVDFTIRDEMHNGKLLGRTAVITRGTFGLTMP